MTRKDYIKIAAIIKEKRNYDTLEFSVITEDMLDELSHEFADMLAEDNPRFDRGRFLEAAGAIGFKKTLAEEKR